MFRSGDAFLRNDGHLDGRSSAVKSGEAFERKDGALDGRCSLAKQMKVADSPASGFGGTAASKGSPSS